MHGESNSIIICSVGDLMICDSPLYASVGVGSKYQAIKDKIYSNCKPVFDEADIVIGNFETVVHTPKDRSLRETQMCCPESVIGDLKDAGFSVLNLANNHCMQHGTEGFESTQKTCVKYGIKPIGIKDESPYIVDKNGVKLAFLSLCIHLEWYEPEHILYEDQIERIISSVKEIRDKEADTVIVVSVHWGDEFAAYPSNAQIALAHKLVDCGANVLLGHHSHVFQGIEEYNNGLIVYGQGNYISDMIPLICRQTGIVKIKIYGSDDLKTEYELIPYGIKKDYIPVSASGNWIEERQKSLEEALNGKRSDDDYWRDISINHSKAHADFKNYFKANISKYKPAISIKMIWDFLGRKLKRVIGTTTDGRVSSMDPVIYDILSGTET